MSRRDESVRRGRVCSGGPGASGTGAGFGGAANLEAFTDIRRVTIRGDIVRYPS